MQRQKLTGQDRGRDRPLSEAPGGRGAQARVLSRADSATDAELVALLLGTNSSYRDGAQLEQAKAILSEAGGLRELLGGTTGAEILRRAGVKASRLSRLRAAVELGRRYMGDHPARGETMRDPKRVAEFLASKLGDLESEVFVCLFLDSRHRLLKYEEMMTGTIDRAAVYPREIVRRVIALNAAAVICAHNHPSGFEMASPADERITDTIRQALELVECRLLDHFVIGEDRIYSFVENGKL